VQVATRPDIVILATAWRERALIRAQLIEEGFEVAATDTWATLRSYLRPGSKPRLALVDLQNLVGSQEILRDLTVLMEPSRVLVLRASATVTQKEIEALGFGVLNRPMTIEDIIAAVRAVLTSGIEAP
jgi:DNA-binding response OmpR family regulator